MVREMREASADLARNVPSQQPPAELRRRVLRESRWKNKRTRRRNGKPFVQSAPVGDRRAFLAFVGCWRSIARLQRELADARAADPFAQATLIALISPTGDHPDAKANVAWQPDLQSGVITINNMPPAGEGHDYQLWAVDADHPDPINSGVIHVEPDGVTRVRFKPEKDASWDTKRPAISLEREAGGQNSARWRDRQCLESPGRTSPIVGRAREVEQIDFPPRCGWPKLPTVECEGADQQT